MKYVHLDSLLLENFKCHTCRQLTFRGDRTCIRGSRSSGRTSIADAWCWVLYGKDSRGSALTEVRPLNGKGQIADPLAVTQVTAEITVDGVPGEFRRSYRRGPQGVWTYGFFLDGVPCRKKTYEKAVEKILGEEPFFLLQDLRRFPEKLTWQQQRAILLDMADLPCDLMKQDSRFGDLAGTMETLSLEQFGRKLQKEKQDLYQAENDLPFRLSEAQGILGQLGFPDFSSLRKQREILEEKRQELLNGDPPDRERIRSLSRKIAGLDRTLGQKTLLDFCGRRVLKLRKDLDRTGRKQQEVQRMEKLLDEFLFSRAVFSEEKMQGLFDGLTVSLIHNQDRAREQCRILSGGIPWRNLSEAEKLRAALSIHKGLSRHYGVCLPLFLEGTLPRNLLPETGQILLFPSGKKREEGPVWQ